MKITQAHLTYYRYKKLGKTPSWASEFKNDAPPSIHYLINSQVKNTVDTEYVLNNLIGILRLARKRGVLIDKMAEMVKRPGCVVLPNKRSNFCRKWLRKIEETA